MSTVSEPGRVPRDGRKAIDAREAPVRAGLAKPLPRRRVRTSLFFSPTSVNCPDALSWGRCFAYALSFLFLTGARAGRPASARADSPTTRNRATRAWRRRDMSPGRATPAPAADAAIPPTSGRARVATGPAG